MNQLVESNTLADVACQVIETTAFAFSQVSPPGESALPDEGVLRAEVGFAGHATGTIRFEAAYEAATTLSGNLLGLDSEDVTEQQALEGACEMLNMIAGQWLTRVYGVKAVFQLGIPHPCDELPLLDQVVDLLVDDFPLRLQLRVNA